jgi:hypothetical protein
MKRGFKVLTLILPVGEEVQCEHKPVMRPPAPGYRVR